MAAASSPQQAVVSLDMLRTSLGEEKSPFVLRTSDRILFKRCRRLWGWMSHLRQGHVLRESADYLWFGTGVHFALEDYHGLNTYGHPAKAFMAYVMASATAKVLPGTWQELQEMGLSLMSYYSDEWLRSRPALDTYELDGVPQVEVNGAIELDYRTPDGRRVLYGFTMDRIIIDEYGRLWIVEYKTAKQIRLFHFDVDEQITSYCTPLSTEILTRRGWKKHNELVIGEQILGYNNGTDRLEWTRLEDVHYPPGEHETVKVSNKSFEFVCTPEHKWAQVNTANTWPTGKESKFELKPIKAGQQHNYVVLSAPYSGGLSSVTPDEAAVISWLLTDGTYTAGASICQSRKKYSDQVQSLLDKFPDCYSRISDRDECNIWHLRAPFFKGLWDKAGLNLDLDGWENFLLGLSPEAIQQFCEVALMAEGDTNGNFCQNKGRKQELFRLAFFLNGKFPTKGCSSGGGNGFPNNGTCETFTPGTPHKWTRTISVQPAGDRERVWCPQTGLRTWVMRQGSQIAITGNCWCAWKLYNVVPAGVIYQQFRKAVPTLPKVLATGKISTDARQSTSASLYAKMLEDMYGTVEAAPSPNILCLNKFRAMEDEHKDRFIVRHFIERNENQLKSFERKIYMELEDVTNPNLPLYPNATKDCEFMCPLQAACVAMDDGSDWEGTLSAYSISTDDGLTQREKEQRRWRDLLPEPNHIQLPKEAGQYQQLLSELEQQDSYQIAPEQAFLEELGMS